jgi:hypothetical protein
MALVLFVPLIGVAVEDGIASVGLVCWLAVLAMAHAGIATTRRLISARSILPEHEGRTDWIRAWIDGQRLRPGPAGWWLLRGRVLRGGLLLGERGCCERGPDVAVMGTDRIRQGLGEIPPQMPAVRDLPGLWGTRSRTFRVGAGPVLADDLRLGVSAQPGGRRGGVFPLRATHREADECPGRPGASGNAAPGGAPSACRRQQAWWAGKIADLTGRP